MSQDSPTPTLEHPETIRVRNETEWREKPRAEFHRITHAFFRPTEGGKIVNHDERFAKSFPDAERLAATTLDRNVRVGHSKTGQVSIMKGMTPLFARKANGELYVVSG